MTFPKVVRGMNPTSTTLRDLMGAEPLYNTLVLRTGVLVVYKDMVAPA